MTIQELCEKSGLNPARARIWLETGLILPVEGRRREFAVEQVERVRVIRALQDKGVALKLLTGRNLTFPTDEKFVIFDGRELRACRDAEVAIAAVVRAKCACSAVDLAAIRTALAT
jgi:hypothetical protein